MTIRDTRIGRFVPGTREEITLPDTGSVAQRLFEVPVGRSFIRFNAPLSFEVLWGTDNTTDASVATTANKESISVDELPDNFEIPIVSGVIQRFMSITATSNFTIEIWEVE